MSITTNSDERIVQPTRGRAPARARPIMLPLLFAVAGVLGSGCSDAEPGQVVVGIVTDLPWHDPLDNLVIQVYKAPSDATGAPVLVGDDEVVTLTTNAGLPGTYVLRSDGQVPTRIQITARDVANQNLVTRAAVFSLVPGEVRFLRVALVKGCTGQSCGLQQTCIEGSCVSPVVNPDDIVAYTPQAATDLDCAGPSNFLVTATGQPMPFRGLCSAGRACVEGTCRLVGTGP